MAIGDIAQSEKTVTINRPIEKISALLDEKCRTSTYKEDCIPDCGIYCFARLGGFMNSLGAKLTVQITKIDDNSTSVNIKGSGLLNSQTSVANLDSYIIETIKYLNGAEPTGQNKPTQQPSGTCETTIKPTTNTNKAGMDFLWVMLALMVTIGGIVIYFMYFYN